MRGLSSRGVVRVVPARPRPVVFAGEPRAGARGAGRHPRQRVPGARRPLQPARDRGGGRVRIRGRAVGVRCGPQLRGARVRVVRDRFLRDRADQRLRVGAGGSGRRRRDGVPRAWGPLRNGRRAVGAATADRRDGNRVRLAGRVRRVRVDDGGVRCVARVLSRSRRHPSTRTPIVRGGLGTDCARCSTTRASGTTAASRSSPARSNNPSSCTSSPSPNATAGCRRWWRPRWSPDGSAARRWPRRGRAASHRAPWRAGSHATRCCSWPARRARSSCRGRPRSRSASRSTASP